MEYTSSGSSVSASSVPKDCNICAISFTVSAKLSIAWWETISAISLGFRIFLQLVKSMRRAKAETCGAAQQLAPREVGGMSTADGADVCCGALAGGHQNVARQLLVQLESTTGTEIRIVVGRDTFVFCCLFLCTLRFIS